MGTRDRLLVNAAALFAAKGFHGVGVEELGGSVGLTGPSMYRHFPTKAALLAELLITVSSSLLEGATEVIADNEDPKKALSALIDRHVEFAITYPDFIRVHERDFGNLEVSDARQVRRLQRRYVELWVDQIQLVRRNETPEISRTMAHGVFGLLNSTPRLRPNQSRDGFARLMHDMAWKALLS